jgi:hypothetical protein
MNYSEPFSEIRQSDHWRVLIRPVVFEPQRIPSLSACWDVVDECRRGLVPHFRVDIDSSHTVWGNDWIQFSEVRPGEMDEVWRLFQSGMFVEYLRFWEDFHEVPWSSSRYPQTGKPSRYLIWTTTLYRITGIMEFAARLAERNILGPRALVSIGLHGLSDRVLTSWESSFDFDEFTFNHKDLVFEQEYSQSDFLSSSDDLAAQATAYFFERVGWRHPDLEVFKRWQARVRRYNGLV